jgi:Sec-independent protein translocase protein TatA
MQKLIVIGFAALCLIGTSSLGLADEAMKSEMGGMKDEMKAEKNAMKSDMKVKKEEMKGKMKARKGAIKAKRHEMRKKMKAHKVAGQAKVGEAKDAAQSMGQDMKATVPAAPAPAAAP